VVTHGPPDTSFEDEREIVQRRLEERFPGVDRGDISAAIDAAATATEGAKVQSYRALLVEHRASDLLRAAQQRQTSQLE
jgi:hypothetical protein